ncbi:hypothetical protein PG994_006965 [Apiospora phragmitis]|uniref:Uncharacterized protein n=1 Tax=Apiospora phragmitis TaxID=2905665 RepID=A0ABR1VGI7_9PEZI
MDEFLIGIGQIQVVNLSVDLCRDKDENAIKKLQSIFQRHCEPEIDINHIEVKLWPSELDEVLASSAISFEDLARTRPPFRQIRSSRKIDCIHGRQRLEAAMRTSGPETWWTAKLYCIPEGTDPLLLLQPHAERYHYETRRPDGYIYWKVRQYQEQGDSESENEWMGRLSLHKQKALKRLLDLPEIVVQLDRLTKRFPGLRSGLELGNVEKHLASRGREAMERCLEHTFEVWDKISLQEEDIGLATDTQTVENIQRLAPSASRKDRILIQQLMCSRVLYPLVNNMDRRKRIESAILGLGVMIPSIKTFHENMKYFSIGADILKSKILTRLKKDQSLYEAMRQIWRRPSRCQIEYREEDFREVPLNPDFNWSYLEVFISAMRYFPWISDHSPRWEKGNTTNLPGSKNHYLLKLLRRARMQGFASEKIDTEIRRLASSQGEPEEQRIESSGQNEEQLGRRCGRPFMESWKHMTNHLFIPQLLLEPTNADHPTTLFVQQDILRAFFGEFPNCNTLARSPTITDQIARGPIANAGQNHQASNGGGRSSGQPVESVNSARSNRSQDSEVEDGVRSYLSPQPGGGPSVRTRSTGRPGSRPQVSEIGDDARSYFSPQLREGPSVRTSSARSYLGPLLQTWPLSGEARSHSQVNIEGNPLVMAAAMSARQNRHQGSSISDVPTSQASRTSFNTSVSSAAFSTVTSPSRPSLTYSDHLPDYTAGSVSPLSRETRSTHRTFITPTYNR